MILRLALLMVATAGCGAPAAQQASLPPPASDPPPPVVASATTTAPPAAPAPEKDDAARGIDLARCRAHAGGGERHGTKGGATTSSCWFNAECSLVPGESHPGDGIVSISCKDDQCACSYEPDPKVQRPGPGFTATDACVGDGARRLLFERCLRRPAPREGG